MQFAYNTYGDTVYNDLASLKEHITAWCEDNALDLTSKNKKKLLSPATWKKNRELVQLAQKLHGTLGEKEYMDFNIFSKEADRVFKELKLKPSASQKKAIYAAVSEYDEHAEKVVKKKQKLNGDKLSDLLVHLGCAENDLADFGYCPGRKPGEFVTYETETNLRDTENVPLKEAIHTYFLREVKPHVPEAWINLDATKIGYEISFNKYFYKHTPLRSIEEVTHDILELEKQSDGLIAEILNLS